MSEETTLMAAARQAIATGNHPEARRLLRQAVRHESANYRAWLWLAGITEKPDAALQYARRAHELHPEDQRVRDALAWAEERAKTAPVGERVTAGNQVPVRTAPIRTAPVRETPRPLPVRKQNGTTPTPEPTARPVSSPPESADEPEPVPAPGTTARWVLFGIALLAFLAVLAIFFLLQNRGYISSPVQTVAAAAQYRPAKLPAIVVRHASAPAAFAGNAPEQSNAEGNSIALDTMNTRILPKQSLPIDKPLPAWTPTPTPPPTPTPTPTQPASPRTLFNGSSTEFNEYRWIDVNLTTQIVTAYENGVAVFSTYGSTGKYGTPTVTGQFRIYYRLEAQNMSGYHLGYDYYIPNVPYVQYFHGDYAFHGAYWHNNFGTPSSHGCVNLTPADAQWLYNFATIGTLVNVHY